MPGRARRPFWLTWRQRSGDLLATSRSYFGLARELWIRLEGETTLRRRSSAWSGEEAQRKGVIGPISIGMLYPEVLQEILRSLRPGELPPPRQIGEWHVLLRLERSTPQV